MQRKILKSDTRIINLKCQQNEESELPDRSYSISDIQGYSEYIFKKHGEKTVNSSI